MKKRYKAIALNTFDSFGTQECQHYKRDEEILNLIKELQPDKNKIMNLDKYFQKPAPIECAFRVFK